MSQRPVFFPQVVIFDTTLRDGELAPNVRMSLEDKLAIATLLEKLGVDVIEVGYPGQFEKDFEDIRQVAALVKQPIICGLAGSHPDEIVKVAEALKFASRSRINLFTPVNVKADATSRVLQSVENSVTLASQYCSDVQWSAFDATRSAPDFLCQEIEVAITSGARTITIPDTMGDCPPEDFVSLLQRINQQVPNIQQAVLAVHCHTDRGFAVANSVAALGYGVRQIECSINGLGARTGNADLRDLWQTLNGQDEYKLRLDLTWLPIVEQRVRQVMDDR
jgi:2-isopropylmalate synthase